MDGLPVFVLLNYITEHLAKDHGLQVGTGEGMQLGPAVGAQAFGEVFVADFMGDGVRSAETAGFVGVFFRRIDNGDDDPVRVDGGFRHFVFKVAAGAGFLHDPVDMLTRVLPFAGNGEKDAEAFLGDGSGP